MFDDDTTIRPLDGVFDVPRVEKWLRGLPFTRQNGSEFLVADSYEAEDAAVRTHMLLIDVAPGRIVVATRSASTEPAAELVRWLEKQGRVSVTGAPLAPAPPRACRRRETIRGHAPVGQRTGDFLFTQRLHGTGDRGVFGGYEADHERDVLITVNTPPRDDAPPPRLHRTKGIARFRFAGTLDDGEHPGVLVEDEPPGASIGPHRLPEATALKYATELLWILDDADAPLGGLTAELVYAENGAVTEIAPRGQAFIESGPPYCYGVPQLFTTGYLAPEHLAGKPYDEAADVFAAGIILSYWLTGEHPFDGEYGQRIFSIMLNRRRPWDGPPALAATVDAMLSPSPADRPLAVEVITALERHTQSR